jgi:hypothetical protein
MNTHAPSTPITVKSRGVSFHQPIGAQRGARRAPPRSSRFTAIRQPISDSTPNTPMPTFQPVGEDW